MKYFLLMTLLMMAINVQAGAKVQLEEIIVDTTVIENAMLSVWQKRYPEISGVSIYSFTKASNPALGLFERTGLGRHRSRVSEYGIGREADIIINFGDNGWMWANCQINLPKFERADMVTGSDQPLITSCKTSERQILELNDLNLDPFSYGKLAK